MTHSPIVIIHWWDAASWGNSLHTRTDAGDLGLIPLWTVGFLVAEKKDCFLIAGEEQAEDGRFRHIVSVPKNEIIEMWEVK